MEDTLVSDIKRLRVLTPSDCDNMDGLVPDLCHALEETSCSRSSSGKNIKKERFWKRKFRSGSSLTYCTTGITLKSSAVSDDSESSLDDKIRFGTEDCGSHRQTDSDDMNPKYHQQKLQSWRRATNMVESDSVNENFHPAREHKRKRKFKRMVVDPQPNVKNEIMVTKYLLTIPSKHSKFHKGPGNLEKISDGPNDLENIRGRCVQSQKLFCGKRKRSIREKSIECNIIEKRSGFTTILNSYDWLCGNQSMDCETAEYHSFQCINGLSSSDDSDNGFVTNDEGREADDEHSDVNPTAGISSDLQHSFRYLSACGKVQASPIQEQWQSDGIPDEVEEQANVYKPEHMQVESSLIRSALRYEGTKRRRRTPPSTQHAYGESTLEVSTTHMNHHCRESHNGIGLYTEGVKSASKVSKSNHLRRKNFLELSCESHQGYNILRPSIFLSQQTIPVKRADDFEDPQGAKQNCRDKTDSKIA